MVARDVSAAAGIVVITGASTGFGHALADAFASAGTPVVGVGRSADGPLAPGCAYATGDIRDRRTIECILALVGERSVDLLINNAAIGGKERELSPAALAELRAAIDVNAMAHLELMVALRDALARAANPLIVNVTSRMGSLDFTRSMPADMRPASLAYAVSKATLDMLTMRLARSAFAGCHVVGLDPGPLRTSMGRPDATRTPEAAAHTFVKTLSAIRDAPAGEIVDLLSFES